MRKYINQHTVWVLGLVIWAILYFHFHVGFWKSILEAVVIYFAIVGVWGLLSAFWEDIDIMKE